MQTKFHDILQYVGLFVDTMAIFKQHCWYHYNISAILLIPWPYFSNIVDTMAIFQLHYFISAILLILWQHFSILFKLTSNIRGSLLFSIRCIINWQTSCPEILFSLNDVYVICNVSKSSSCFIKIIKNYQLRIQKVCYN